MNITKQPPMVIVQRYLAIEALKDLGAELVQTLNPNLVIEFVEEDEEGLEVTKVELDYEYLLFEAPMYQIELAFKKLEEDNPEKVSSLIGTDGKNIKYSKPQRNEN